MSTNDSKIKQWSTTPANNGLAPNTVPQGWPDNMAVGDVNECARQMMTNIRYQWEDAQWFNYEASASAISKVSTTVFQIVNTDATSRYIAGRRLKIFDDATRYGTITISSYDSVDTNVTVDFDSGAFGASLTAVALSIITPNNVSVPTNNQTGVDNLLINGDFIVAQRGATFNATAPVNNNDGDYVLDRWILLSDGNDVVDVTQDKTVSTLPLDRRSSIKLEVETANKKAGIMQIIENNNSSPLIGGLASFAFQAAKTAGGNLDKLRAAILGWKGTGDVPTKDPVNVWGAEGTDPTLLGSWTYQSTPVDLTLSTTFVDFKVQTAAISATVQNVAVFVWIDNTDAAVDEAVWITGAHLNEGAFAGEFEAKSISEELDDCKRYYEKSYDIDTAPATVVQNGRLSVPAYVFTGGLNSRATPLPFTIPYQVEKRRSVVAADVVFYSPATGASANVRVSIRGNNPVSKDMDADAASTVWTIDAGGTNNSVFYPNTNANIGTIITPVDARHFAAVEFHYTTNVEIGV